MITNRNHQIFLQRDILNFEGRYVETRFYLIKKDYQIKYIIKELNAIDGNGNMISRTRMKQQSNNVNFHNFVFVVNLLEVQDRNVMEKLKESMNESQRSYFLRVNPEKWLDMQAIHTKQFYRNLFSPLVKLLQESLKVTYPTTSRMKVSFENKNIPIHRKEYISREDERKLRVHF